MALYWVGGTGNWSDATNHWATTSGGAPGAGNLPTATDDVFFDSASHTTSYTVTIDATTKLCRDLTFAAPASGNVTWAGSVAMTVSGSMTLYSGLVRTYTGTLTFNSTTSGKTITMNGVTLASLIEINGVGGVWTLQDNFTTTGGINHRNGTLDTNGKTVGFSDYTNLTGTSTLTLGASTLNLTGGFQVAGTLTFNPNTSTINITGNNATISTGGRNFNIVNVTVGSSTTQFTDSASLTYASLTITGGANKTGSVSFSGNNIITGTLTINGNSSINRVLVKSGNIGTARTLTAATVTVTNADFQDITGAGAGSWNLSAISGNSGDCGGNSGITFTTPVTTNWTSGATWSTATWSSRVPLPQDTATFTTAGVATITQDMPRIGSVDFSTSADKTWTTSTNATIYGSIDLTNLATLTASAQSYTIEGRGSNTFKSAGKVWGKGFTFNMGTGSMTLSDDFVFPAGDSITFNTGTFSANGFNVTGGQVSSNTTTTRTINLGSGTWEINRAGSTTAWFMNATGLTINASTSTIKFTGTTNDAQTFAGAGKTYNNVWFARGASTGNITISGTNTFADIRDTGTVAHSLLFTAGTTQTLTTFTVSGTAGNLITINSTTTATHALVKAGGGTISCDYLNIQHSVATPSSTWYAGTNSTDNQAVATAGSGWIFTAPPAGGTSTAGFLMFF